MDAFRRASGICRAVLRRSVSCVVFLAAIRAILPNAVLFAQQSESPPAAPAASEDSQIRLERDGLWNQALQLRMEGKLSEAIDIGERVVAIERQWLGPDSEDVLGTTNWLAEQYELAENWDAAEARRKQALDWWQAHRGGEHWQTIDARLALDNVRLLSNLTPDQRSQLAISRVAVIDAYRLHKEGHYSEAIASAEEALAIRKGILGPSHPDTALVLNNLAYVCRAHDEYERAIALFEQALAIRRTVLGESHPETADTLNNLGVACQLQGDYARAAPLLIQALGIRKRVLGAEHPDTVISLSSLGSFYAEQGDFARALPLSQQALSIRQRQQGNDPASVAVSLNNLAWIYTAQGDYERAIPLLEQALSICKNLRGNNHPDTAMSLNSLAWVHYCQEDYPLAQKLYEQALDTLQQIKHENSLESAAILSNLALTLQAQGSATQAKPVCEKALAIRSHILGDQHRDTAWSLNNLALISQRQGDFTTALPLFQQARAVLQRTMGESHPETTTCLHNLATLYRLQGDEGRAMSLLEKALANASQHVSAAAIALTERQQLILGQNMRRYLDSYLSCLQDVRGHEAKAYQHVISWKGATIARQRAARIAADHPEIRELFAELQSVTRRWATMVQASAVPADVQSWRARIDELMAQKDELEAKLSRASSAYGEALRKVTLDDLQAEIPPDTALVDYLEYSRSRPSKSTPGQLDRRLSFLAFVVRPGQPVQMFDLGPAAPVNEAVDAWRRNGLRETYGRSPQSRAAAKLLRETLWQPLADAIGNVKTVLISPDGSLGRLPFAALPGKEAGTYLLEEYRLALVPVPQLIAARDGKRRVLPKEALVVGGVDYNAPPKSTGDGTPALPPSQRPLRSESDVTPVFEITTGRRFEPLIGTISEANNILALYRQGKSKVPNSKLVELRGSDATEERFRAEAPNCFALHVATHAYFADESKKSGLSADVVDQAVPAFLASNRAAVIKSYSPGLLSGIVLAGANDSPPIPDDPAQWDRLPDDGILTADEISCVPLTGVGLVVLSACETGLGQVAGGEGLLGIQRAFQVAGARATIATLWNVDDTATNWIMIQFYTNYLEHGMTALDALRAAQLWALKNPNQVLRGVARPPGRDSDGRLPPGYWAAFTLSGDWR